MNAYVAIALDLGTTSIKAGLLDQDGLLTRVVSLPAPKITVNGGRYESDALAYVNIAGQVLQECASQAEGCTTLGMCSQRSSFLIWDKASGQPMTPLISWQDNRGVSSCEELRGQEQRIRALTGLPLAPYYFAPKLRAVLHENPVWKTRLVNGEWLVGTLDTFLIWHWSGGKYFVTDASMAARTLLLDIDGCRWSGELCDVFEIPPGILPEINSSMGMDLELNNGLRLQASVGDQSAALVAGIAADGSEVIVNLGTGCFVARYLPAKAKAPAGYLNTLVYRDRSRVTYFAAEGTLNAIANALAPYPVNECGIADLAQADIFCLAEPAGLGAPYFRSDLGLLFSAPVDHLNPYQVAALLIEAVIFRVARVVEDFNAHIPLKRVYLSGGLSGLPCLQSGIAQCVPVEVFRLQQNEASLQGAALLAAGLQAAACRDMQKIVPGVHSKALPAKYQRWKVWLDSL